jgi:hypothetical protein
MTVTISGSTGIANPLGSASSPAETNTTSSNTGAYFPSSTTYGIATNGTNALYVDGSQNVGIGTSSPTQKLDVYTASANYSTIAARNTISGFNFAIAGTGDAQLVQTGAYTLQFATSNTERMRIDSSGNLLVGTTTQYDANRLTIAVVNNGIGITGNSGSTAYTANGSGNHNFALMRINGTAYGSISVTTSGTSYNVSSDYRLKHSVTPLTTGLATVSALNPVTYKWNADDSYGEGFIAHELQAVIPNAVTGEKDAVNEDGSIKPQGVDYSKIVVHLVAAIQELKAEFDAYKASHP